MRVAFSVCQWCVCVCVCVSLHKLCVSASHTSDAVAKHDTSRVSVDTSHVVHADTSYTHNVASSGAHLYEPEILRFSPERHESVTPGASCAASLRTTPGAASLSAPGPCAHTDATHDAASAPTLESDLNVQNEHSRARPIRHREHRVKVGFTICRTKRTRPDCGCHGPDNMAGTWLETRTRDTNT